MSEWSFFRRFQPAQSEVFEVKALGPEIPIENFECGFASGPLFDFIDDVPPCLLFEGGRTEIGGEPAKQRQDKESGEAEHCENSSSS
jgi:hypothetical protein